MSFSIKEYLQSLDNEPHNTTQSIIERAKLRLENCRIQSKEFNYRLEIHKNSILEWQNVGTNTIYMVALSYMEFLSLEVTEKYELLFIALDILYQKNWYHNSYHACQVALFLNSLIDNSALRLSKEIKFMVFLAALSHDLGHPGCTHHLLKENNHKIIQKFHDVDALERLHISLYFKICGALEIVNSAQNFLDVIPADEFITVTATLILNTCMPLYTHYLNLLSDTSSDKNLLPMVLFIRCADLSHVFVSKAHHISWCVCVYKELRFSSGNVSFETFKASQPAFWQEHVQTILNSIKKQNTLKLEFLNEIWANYDEKIMFWNSALAQNLDENKIKIHYLLERPEQNNLTEVLNVIGNLSF